MNLQHVCSFLRTSSGHSPEPQHLCNCSLSAGQIWLHTQGEGKAGSVLATLILFCCELTDHYLCISFSKVSVKYHVVSFIGDTGCFSLVLKEKHDNS